jgi:hypothetical protein
MFGLCPTAFVRRQAGRFFAKPSGGKFFSLPARYDEMLASIVSGERPK